VGKSIQARISRRLREWDCNDKRRKEG